MASSSEEMDRVALEDDAPNDGPARARVSGPVLRGSIARDADRGAFDDVTPTRSLAEVGLADMDEDLPTRMQNLDELARFRAAAADEAASPSLPDSTARRDVRRPPPALAITPSKPPVFRSFPPPPGREAVASAHREPIPSEAPAPGPEPIDRGTKILLVLSVVMMALAAAALVIERFVP